MRKKDLIQQNIILSDALHETQFELKVLKKQLKSYSEEIKTLKSEISKNKDTLPKSTEPMQRLEQKIITNATLKPDMEYGAKTIGEIVIAAAQYSNKLTIGSDDSKKELVNLILGKTEIAKAEILSVVETNDTFDVKCLKMDQIATVTKEYFESVIAQIV